MDSIELVTAVDGSDRCVEVKYTPGYFWPGNYDNPPEGELPEILSVIDLEDAEEVLPKMSTMELWDLTNRVDQAHIWITRSEDFGGG